MKKVRLGDLKNHPKNSEIYELDNEPINDLADQMDKLGLQHPIIITDDNVIVSGHRRVKAANKLGWQEIDAEVKSFKNEMEILEFLVVSNLYRIKKSTAVLTREGRYLLEIEKVKAKERKMAALTNNLRKVPEDEMGRATEKVCKRIGMKKTNFETAEKLLSHYEKLKDPDEESFYVKMLNNNVSGSKTAFEMDLYSSLKPEDRQSLIKKPSKLNAEIQKFEMAKYKNKYSAVLLNIELDEDAFKLLKDVPLNAMTKPNSALFMYVSPNWLSDAINLIKHWKFTYFYNFVVTWNDRDLTDSFIPNHMLLLLAKKGDIGFEAFSDQISHKHRGDEEVPYMDRIQNMFPTGKKVSIIGSFDGWETFSPNGDESDTDSDDRTEKAESVMPNSSDHNEKNDNRSTSDCDELFEG